MNLATYTLQIMGPEPETAYGFKWKEVEKMNGTDKRVLANLPAMVEAAEEDFTDLLPDGYTARIREWQEEAVTE